MKRGKSCTALCSIPSSLPKQRFFHSIKNQRTSTLNLTSDSLSPAKTFVKMAKRVNEHSSQSEAPSAKRSITSEQQQALKVQEAQDALDKLDYKTTEGLCTKVSERE